MNDNTWIVTIIDGDNVAHEVFVNAHSYSNAIEMAWAELNLEDKDAFVLSAEPS